ncbi:MAG: hypothetical protein LC808_26470 [Actinobacteria bacterium]|nr:hypothetical protein [Actinomycetota bacterium]
MAITKDVGQPKLDTDAVKLLLLARAAPVRQGGCVGGNCRSSSPRPNKHGKVTVHYPRYRSAAPRSRCTWKR